jgi:hypothetical protein
MEVEGMEMEMEMEMEMDIIIVTIRGMSTRRWRIHILGT